MLSGFRLVWHWQNGASTVVPWEVSDGNFAPYDAAQVALTAMIMEMDFKDWDRLKYMSVTPDFEDDNG